ncbi:hypothetical protein Tco_1036830 [Tanacetum coccineum]
MKDKVMPYNSQVMIKNKKVEDHHRISSISNKTKSVTACDDSLSVKTSNSKVVYVTYDKCVFNSNHDACASKYINDVNARTKKPNVVPINHRNHPIHRTVRFGNDQFALILGYGDFVQGNVTIKRVYYVEGLNHNLFSIGQFCDADFEVAFRKPTCFVRDLQGNDLLMVKDGGNLDKLKDKGDPCIFIGYATQSKGYRVYNNRTRIIVESIHINIDELKEVTTSDNNTSSLVPQRKMTFEHNNSGLRINDHINEPSSSKPVPNVVPTTNMTHTSLQKLELLFSPMYEE